MDRIGAPLGGGALEHRWRRLVADPGAELGPLGVELCPLVTLQDLADRRSLKHTPLRDQMERRVELCRAHPPTGMCGFVALVRSVLVVHRLPAP
jgi:hypothetical protein